MKITLVIFAVLYLIPVTSNTSTCDAGIGKTVNNVQLRNADDVAMSIPHFGQKVLAVFYNDPDAKDVNNPLSDAIKERKFPKEKYTGIGIANCADTWLPNSVIRYAAREKEKKYPGAVILIDDDHILSKAWELPNGDDKAYIVIIGKDLKIKYIKLVKNQEESKAIIQAVIAVLDAEIAKIN